MGSHDTFFYFLYIYIYIIPTAPGILSHPRGFRIRPLMAHIRGAALGRDQRMEMGNLEGKLTAPWRKGIVLAV